VIEVKSRVAKASLLEVLERGLASPEHAEFVAGLREIASKKS
jgi:hypothetical protein